MQVGCWVPLRLCAFAGDAKLASPAKPKESGVRRQASVVKRHESVYLGDFERQLLLRLDGTRDWPALVKELGQLVKDGELNVEKDGQAVCEEERPSILTEAVQRQLEVMARSALLES